MRRTGIVLAASLAWMGCAQADEAPAVKPLAQPATIDARLSPDGKRVAVIATYQGRPALYVHSLVEGGTDGKIVRSEDYTIGWVRWKDDRHLIAGVKKNSGSPVTRLVSVDPSGEHLMMIGEPVGGFPNTGSTDLGIPVLHPKSEDRVLSVLPKASGEILQEVLDKFPAHGEDVGLAIYRVDIDTADHALADKGDYRMSGYVIDGNDVARIGIERGKDETTFYGRADKYADWREIQRVKAGQGEIFTPLAFQSDNQRLYVLSNKGPGGKAGLWSFDAVSGRFADLIDEQADLSQEASAEDGVLHGYRRKDGSWVYLDPAWQADYLAVAKAMKGAEVRIVDRAADGLHVLLEAHQKNQPKVWWVLDRSVKPLNLWVALEEYPDSQPSK